MRRWPRSRAIVVGLTMALFVLCCVLPVVYLAAVSLTGSETLFRLVVDSRQRRLFSTTCLLGMGTALLATIIGAPLGIALARITLPSKDLLRVALAAPVVLPPYVVGLAWTYFATDWIYSLPAATLVLSLVLYPIAMLATEVSMRRIDGRLEEAALMVAPSGRILRRITLPLAAPGIVAAALLIFVMAVSEFGVPALLRVPVYTTEVFTAFAALYDFGRAVVTAVPLLLLCLVVAVVAASLIGDRLLVTRRSAGTPPVSFDHWRWTAAIGAAVVLAVAVALPLVILVREATGARAVAVAMTGSGEAIANSLWLAVIGATLVVILSIWLGYIRGRAVGRNGWFLDVLFVIVYAVPSTIVGVGLIGVWNRSGPAGLLYGTDAMLLLGYLARFVPVAALVIAASTRYVPVSHEEAASVSGAGWPRMMWRIVLPQIKLGVVAAWVIAFILAFGELGVSILVAPPGEATLPIRVYTLIANTPSSHVATLALLQTMVVLAPLAALGAVVSFRGRR